MQRLFSTFPDGRPGAGLLLLRGAVGGWFVLVSGTYLAQWGQGGWWRLAAGLLAGMSGASLLIGFLTPLAVVTGLVAIGLPLYWPRLGLGRDRGGCGLPPGSWRALPRCSTVRTP